MITKDTMLAIYGLTMTNDCYSFNKAHKVIDYSLLKSQIYHSR